MKINILGPHGTFSEEAAIKYYPDNELVFCNTITNAIKKASEDKNISAFVPIENSLEGAVSSTMDSLADTENLYISAEHSMHIHHCLMSKENNIKTIITHAQPLGQCSKFLNSVSDVNIKISSSTAEGAKFAETSDGVGVIGSKMLGKIYNLNIIKENIEDNLHNKTRFVLLSHSYSKRTGNDKTSIMMSVLHKPGELLKMLSILDIFDINMNKIESRPAKTTLGEYFFFIDIDGHIDDKNVSDALSVIRQKAVKYKFLGSYPKKS